MRAKDLSHFRELYLRMFSREAPPNAIISEMYEVFLEFLADSGHDLLPPELKDAERMIIKSGLVKQYFLALCEGQEELSDSDTLIYLVTAKPSQRIRAISKTLKVDFKEALDVATHTKH